MANINIPWHIKILVKIAMSRIPFGYALWQRLGLFRHGQMDNSDYAIRIFRSHLKNAGIVNPKGMTLLELGPGDSIATAIIAAAYGAKPVLVDAGAFVRTDMLPYMNLVSALSEEGLAPPDISKCTSVYEILISCNAQYLTDGLKSLQQLESRSVDLIFSQAVLEHIRYHEFQDSMLECYRLLKENCHCSHQVDLRDHLSEGLNNLRFSRALWESRLFSSAGFYTNRIRCDDMLDYFSQAGFQILNCTMQRWDSLPINRKELNSEFRSKSDDELCISVFDVLLCKPAITNDALARNTRSS
jgi:hypothetical protein